MSLSVTKSEFLLTLGDARITAVTHQAGEPFPTYINVHDDEDTSVAAGLESLKERGGRLIELCHNGQRLITFKLGVQTYKFDPNRVFSDAGIISTLNKHSQYSAEAHQALKTFAAEYLEHFNLDQEPVILALHNTIDGTLSIESFLPEAELAGDAELTSVGAGKNKFDFYYVTHRAHYEYLKSKGFNVTLQGQGVADDGSLSVHFAQRGVPYVNIEANIFNLTEQIIMVRAAREMLDAVRI